MVSSVCAYSSPMWHSPRSMNGFIIELANIYAVSPLITPLSVAATSLRPNLIIRTSTSVVAFAVSDCDVQIFDKL